MKHKTPPIADAQNVFADGIAMQIVSYVSVHLPSIMILLSLAITIALATLDFMHIVALFKFVINVKVRYVVAFVVVASLDLNLFAFSLASAGLRSYATKLESVLGKVLDKKGAERPHPRVAKLRNWANTFFVATLVGRLGFTALRIYWLQGTGDTEYFHTIAAGEAINLSIFLQVLNIVATFGAEGSAFLLNSNASLAYIEPDTTNDVSGGNPDVSGGNQHARGGNQHAHVGGDLQELIAQMNDVKN